MRSHICGFWRQLSWLMPLSTFIVIYSTPIWGIKEVCIILLWVLTYFKIILSPNEDIYPSIRGFSMIIELLAWIFMFKSFETPHSFFPKEYWSPKCWEIHVEVWGVVLLTHVTVKCTLTTKGFQTLNITISLPSSIGEISKNVYSQEIY